MKLSKSTERRLGLGSVLAVVALAGLLAPQRASAQNVCMQTNYNNHGQSQSLNCSANDVRIAEVDQVVDPVTGQQITTCFRGQDLTFNARFKVVLTAQDRYDIGLYLATDGDTSGDGALTGQCRNAVITSANAPATFINSDSSPDICGDIKGKESTTQNPNPYNPQYVYLTVTTTCQAGIGTNRLALPNCTSWRQTGANEICDEANDAYPGAPSKCNCDQNFTIPVLVETPNLTIDKTASPTECNEPGCEVTYTVKVNNPAIVSSATLTKLVDDPDNNPTTLNSITFDANSTPKLSDICTSLTIPAQGFITCSFKLAVSGTPGAIITDKACIEAINNTDGSALPNICDTAVVTIKDVKPTPVLTKKVEGPVCALINYSVKIQNTSTTEALTLKTGLKDDGVDITTLSSTVIFGTTCGVATGIGTLAGTAGAGTLPKDIAPSGNYTCTFDRLVCAFPHIDTVTASLTDGETADLPVSGSATVTGVQLTVPQP